MGTSETISFLTVPQFPQKQIAFWVDIDVRHSQWLMKKEGILNRKDNQYNIIYLYVYIYIMYYILNRHQKYMVD